MIREPLVRDGISGLIDIVGRCVTNVTLASGQDLGIWLPGLGPPPNGWSTANVANHRTPTRIAVHGNQSGDWDACEIINMWAFTGRLSAGTITANIACTLNSVGAENIISSPVQLPPSACSFDVTSASAEGDFTLSGQAVHGRYLAVLVQGGTDRNNDKSLPRGALLEHNTFTSARANSSVLRDLECMSDAVIRAQMQVLMADRPLAGRSLASPLTSSHIDHKGIHERHPS